jgi:MFS family permease
MFSKSENEPWYVGVTRYQWLVLLIASLGWVFDIFEGQIFVASMNEVLPDLLPPGADPADKPYYANITFAAFLIGGAMGGVLFGRISDRIGRTRTLIYTILVYSLFTCVSALAQTWWQMAILRFLVALGTGGEWAVATALVAEVFPQKARARSLAIFHASSVLGSLLAVAAGAFLVGNKDLGWRWAFVVGAAPALLGLWVRWSLHEPERRTIDKNEEAPTVSLFELFRGPLLGRTLIGVGLATVGLATFWGTHIYGKDVLREAVASQKFLNGGPNLKHWEMVGMLLTTLGGGAGLIFFGPLAERLGRRGAFLTYLAGGLAASLFLFQFLSGSAVWAVALFLPVFGFLTLGLHAGYAVYFPELFPTALRGAGAGLCFNMGRLMAAPILFVSGWLQRPTGWGLNMAGAATLLSLLFPLGMVLLLAAPETRGQELPE